MDKRMSGVTGPIFETDDEKLKKLVDERVQLTIKQKELQLKERELDLKRKEDDLTRQLKEKELELKRKEDDLEKQEKQNKTTTIADKVIDLLKKIKPKDTMPSSPSGVPSGTTNVVIPNLSTVESTIPSQEERGEQKGEHIHSHDDILCPTCNKGHIHKMETDKTGLVHKCTGPGCGEEYVMVNKKADYKCLRCNGPLKKPSEGKELDSCPFCGSTRAVHFDWGKLWKATTK